MQDSVQDETGVGRWFRLKFQKKGETDNATPDIIPTCESNIPKKFTIGIPKSEKT